MRCAALAAAAGAALLWAGPAAAERVADYSVSDARFQELAQNLHASPFPAMPAKGGADVILEAASVDHQLAILGIFCRAWHVQNPLSQMVRRALTAWDRDGDLAPPASGEPIRVKLDGASSTMRCVQVKELKSRCLLTTALSGSASRGDRTVPISIDLEQEQDTGACNGLAQGTSLIGRSAAIALVEKLKPLAD